MLHQLLQVTLLQGTHSPCCKASVDSPDRMTALTLYDGTTAPWCLSVVRKGEGYELVIGAGVTSQLLPPQHCAPQRLRPKRDEQFIVCCIVVACIMGYPIVPHTTLVFANVLPWQHVAHLKAFCQWLHGHFGTQLL